MDKSALLMIGNILDKTESQNGVPPMPHSHNSKSGARANATARIISAELADIADMAARFARAAHTLHALPRCAHTTPAGGRSTWPDFIQKTRFSYSQTRDSARPNPKIERKPPCPAQWPNLNQPPGPMAGSEPHARPTGRVFSCPTLTPIQKGAPHASASTCHWHCAD